MNRAGSIITYCIVEAAFILWVPIVVFRSDECVHMLMTVQCFSMWLKAQSHITVCQSIRLLSFVGLGIGM